MGFEIETKVLEIDPVKVRKILKRLKAKQVVRTRLRVDWFGTKGTQGKTDNWYLRIRTYGNGHSEVTWKGKSKSVGIARKHPEINLLVTDPKSMSEIFVAVGLDKYAHQEKDRESWEYQDWRFDMDTYPNMPTYLEIESSSEKKIQQAIDLLELRNNKTSNEGERILIEKTYGLNWHDMRFK